MQQSAIRGNIDFIPYKDWYVPGSVDYPLHSDVPIESIPPSAFDPSPNERGIAREQNQTQSSNQERVDLVNKLNIQMGESSSEQMIESWLKQCRGLKLALDINRLARFAVCRNALAVVEYLVWKENVDLTCQDVEGRSAIFYAFPSDGMLKCVMSYVPENSKLQIIGHQDRPYGRTPMYYAVEHRNFNAVEFLLEMGADFQIKDRSDNLPTALLAQKSTPGISLDDDTSHIMLIFEFYNMLQIRPHFPIGVWRGGKEQTILLNQLEASWHSPESMVMLGHSTRPFTWIHITEANGIAAFGILWQYGRDMQYPAYVRRAFSSSFRESVRVPMNRSLPYRDPSYESNSKIATDPRQDLQVSIVFPCFVLVERAGLSSRRRYWEKSRAETTDYRFLQSMLQPERTIDEAYFPSLSAKALDARNEHQVVVREYVPDEENTLVFSDAWRPILMVYQLWVWRFGRGILTAYPMDQVYYFKSNGVGSNVGVDRLKHPGIIIGMIIANHISKFGTRKSGEPSTLDIFESGITRILTDVDGYMDTNSSSRPDMRKEHEFMFRIADIREELAMIQEVLEQQLGILDDLINDFEQNNPEKHAFLDPSVEPTDYSSETLQDREDWKVVKRSRTKIEKYQKWAERIDRDAERVEKRIQDQLNLKRTHVSINDARAGLILSTAVIGFTVITIIFAPLAFVTGLFALPVDVFLKNQFQFVGNSSPDPEEGEQSTSAYTTTYVATWFVVAEVVSLVVTILLVVLCLWLLGGAGTFTALQGNKSKELETRSGYSPREDQTDGDKAGNVTGARISLRTRATNLLRRRRHGASIEA